MARELSEAVLLTFGRASYATNLGEGQYGFALSVNSINRANAVNDSFDPDYHSSAVFTGGHPGVAENWPAEHIPPLGHREANLMARPLEARLLGANWTVEEIADRVKKQSESDNTIGDVAKAMERGYLCIDYFHTENHGLETVIDKFQGLRVHAILRAALDISPEQLGRITVPDIYGRPATDFCSAESKPISLAKELAANALTKLVLRDIKPGNVESLFDAEAHFKKLARA